MSLQRLATPDLVRLFEEGSLAGLSDWQLLDRFVSHRDETAFEALVSRHGTMVLGICRRMLGFSVDVDDAFQATFLVLIKRAHALGPSDAIGAWLHGVAVRVARRARADAARRGQREKLGFVVERAGPDAAEHDADHYQILDEEIHRLPFKYRAPIVMCYLEGLTHEAAARQLNWPIGTVKGRLSRARSLLESRLTRRGVACAAGLISLTTPSASEAALAPSLLKITCSTAYHLCIARGTTQFLSRPVARLLHGVLFTMVFQKIKMIVLLCVASGLVLTGAGVLARQDADDQKRGSETTTQKVSGSSNSVKVRGVPYAKAEGSPPRQARPRKKVPDLYNDLIQAARSAYLENIQGYQPGITPTDRIYQSSRMLMEAQQAVAADPAEKTKAVAEHADRMRSLARKMDESHGHEVGDSARIPESKAYLAEAELMLAQAKSPRRESKPSPSPSSASAPAANPGGKHAKDPKSVALLAKLEKPVPMNFPNETPLEEVLKYIKQATAGEGSAGIPIYVDPVGLTGGDRIPGMPITMELEGVPLRRTLQLVLKQLGLVYFVDDGVLCITSAESQEPKFGPSMLEISPFMEKQEKAKRGELPVSEMKELIEVMKLQNEMTKLEKEMDKIKNAPVGGGLQ
jgi:RNA polymerase sigma factor (sigma-70 family)